MRRLLLIAMLLPLTGCMVVYKTVYVPAPPKVCTDQWNGPQDYSDTPLRDER